MTQFQYYLIQLLYIKDQPTQSMLDKLKKWEQEVTFIPYVYATCGNILVVLMQSCMKIVSPVVGSFFAIFFRGIFLFMINYFFIHQQSLSVHQKDKQIWSILWRRTILSAITIVLFLASLAYISLSFVNCLYNLGPVIVYFMEAFINNKPLNKTHLILTIICFIGVMLIIKPGFLFDSSQQNQYSFVLLFPIIAAFTNSRAMIYLHELKGKVSNLIPLHYFYIGQVILAGIIQNFQNKQQISYDQINWFFLMSLVGLVVCAYNCQILITRATYLKKASYIMPFGYVSIVFSFMMDIFIFDENFDTISILGMCLTSSGLLIKLLVKE